MILTDKPIEEMNEKEFVKVEFMKTLATAFKGLVEADFNSANLEIDFRKTSKFGKIANVFLAKFDIKKKLHLIDDNKIKSQKAKGKKENTDE
jgi:hypothetical protein